MINNLSKEKVKAKKIIEGINHTKNWSATAPGNVAGIDQEDRPACEHPGLCDHGCPVVPCKAVEVNQLIHETDLMSLHSGGHWDDARGGWRA